MGKRIRGTARLLKKQKRTEDVAQVVESLLNPNPTKK
jgi:hypothetical protein